MKYHYANSNHKSPLLSMRNVSLILINVRVIAIKFDTCLYSLFKSYTLQPHESRNSVVYLKRHHYH